MTSLGLPPTPPVMRGRGVASWRVAVVTVALASGLAAGAAQEPGSAASATPSAEAQRLQAVELVARSHPEQASQQVQALIAKWPESLRERVRALELEGSLQAGLHEPEAAERAAQQLEQTAQHVDALRERALAAADFVRARVAYHGGPVGRAERLITQALGRLPADAPPLVRVSYLMLASAVQERRGKLDDAVRLELQALNLVDAAGPAWRRSEVRGSLAYTLLQAGQKDRADAMNHEAIEIARAAGDDLAMSSAMTTESMLREDAKDDAGELAALQSAMDHAHHAHSQRDEIFALANMADFYLQRAQYQTSLEMSRRALALSRQVKSVSSESLALNNIGMALIGLRRTDEGMDYVKQSLAIASQNDSVSDMAGTYEELGRFLEKAGEPKQAFEAFRQYRQLADEVFRQEQQQAILEAQEGYDNERRNHELELLNRQNRLKEEELLQHELQQRLWAVGAVLALISFSLVALLVRRGRQANRALADTNALLKVQSERDPLTGLANRRHFQEAMRQLAADGRLAGTLFLIDVDHFKHINDVHGHAAGDAVLIELARRLRGVLREQDLTVRWGGEEFLVVVQSLSPEQIDALVQRLLLAVAGEPIQAGSTRVHVSASIGFATLPLEPNGIALSWERAIELVDTALYLAKAHGRNRAYGVRLMNARDEAEVSALGKTLEQAWRDGRVVLAQQQGPALPEAVGGVA